jgi:transcriptional regulator with XRE-family HTH domain
MIEYTPPTAQQLQRLKEQLGYTGEQMAALASVAGGAQWRKYTGGEQPRQLNLHMLFFIAARLSLDAPMLERIAGKMHDIGAHLDAQALVTPPA